MRENERESIGNLKELPNVIVDSSSPKNGLHDGGELVVQDDDVRGTLRDLRAGDAHRESDVGRLERRGVVSAVSRNAHNLKQLKID